MLGAIIGDLSGSIYEFNQIKQHSQIEVKNIIEKTAFYSDDTILTVAIADAIINKVNFEDKLREYALSYNDLIPKDIPYFKSMFSPNFIKWAKKEKPGISEGNGAMMRISPVGFLFDSEEEVIKNAYLATIITQFNYTCKDTIDLCLYSIFSVNSFEESIKLAISFGGDTDTNACIVGSMAEAFYGIDEKLKQTAMEKLPHKFIEIINLFYQKVNKV